MNRGRRVPCSSSTFCHSLGTGGQLEVATLLPSVLRNYSVLILVAMEQEGKIVKIPSELNFSKCPERFGFCEGSSLIYWLFSCLSSSGISLCLNSKGSVLLHMPWLAVQRFPAAVPPWSAPCSSHIEESCTAKGSPRSCQDILDHWSQIYPPFIWDIHTSYCRLPQCYAVMNCARAMMIKKD